MAEWHLLRGDLGTPYLSRAQLIGTDDYEELVYRDRNDVLGTDDVIYVRMRPKYAAQAPRFGVETRLAFRVTGTGLLPPTPPPDFVLVVDISEAWQRFGAELSMDWFDDVFI